MSVLPAMLGLAMVASPGLAVPCFAQTPGSDAPCVAGPSPRVDVETPFAAQISTGAMHFPPSMLRANTYGACTSMFDLDPAGAPINAETRCEVFGIFVAHPENEQISRDTFANAVNRVLPCMRFASDDAASAGKWRTNIKRVFNFAINGRSGVVPPGEFARPAPASPITPEQAAYFADQRRKAAEAAAAPLTPQVQN